MSCAVNVSGVSVVIVCAAIATVASDPWCRAKSSDTSTAAAAPHVGGQAMSRVITPSISTGEASTSSTDHLLAEQRERIARRVPARLGADLREGLHRRAVLLHVRESGAAEVADRERNLRMADQRVGLAVECIEGRGAVGELGGERARRHLLEAHGERAIDGPGRHRLPGEEQRRRAGRAVVVDVDDRDAGHADTVERLLPGRRVAVDVAGVRLLHVAVRGCGRRRAPRAPRARPSRRTFRSRPASRTGSCRRRRRPPCASLNSMRRYALILAQRLQPLRISIHSWAGSFRKCQTRCGPAITFR